MSNKTEIFQPVPMRMTPSSMAARTSHPYQVCSRKWVTHFAGLLIRYQEEPSRDENSIESKRRMYLNLDRTPADGSSSAQVILYCSTLQEQSIQLKHSCNYYLQSLQCRQQYFQSSSSSSPVSDQSVGINESQSNLSYSRLVPQNRVYKCSIS